MFSLETYVQVYNVFKHFAINIKIDITVKYFETNNACNYVLKYDKHPMLKNALFLCTFGKSHVYTKAQ